MTKIQDLYSIAGHRIYKIDDTPIIIENIYYGYATGYIVKSISDFEPCYIVSYFDEIAYGKIFHEALYNAKNKYDKSLSMEVCTEIIQQLKNIKKN